MNQKNFKIFSTIERLERWFEQNGYAGWDPYDVQDSKVFRLIEKNFPRTAQKISIRILSELNHAFPLLFRKIFRVEKAVNNKGLGLMLSAYSILYLTEKNPKHLEEATRVANYLEQNSNKNYSGMSWGYPFDWTSPILIPAGVPSSVVTSIVGDGFYQLYRATNDEKYLNICTKICEFFLTDLSITFSDPSGSAICFSYTPLDDYQVHNANLFVAEFLIKIGKIIDNKEFVEAGLLAGNFALKEQQTEGYLPYWGLSQTDRYSSGRLHTDHYHCGFEIRCLYSIWKMTNIDQFEASYRAYYSWYKINMFTEEQLPKFMVNNVYPLNVHTCAEAILCRTRLANCDSELECAADIALQVINIMEFRPGEFTHVIRQVLPFAKVKSNIPMLRWGQAWMFLALVTLYSAIARAK